jgi:hypothetical protein
MREYAIELYGRVIKAPCPLCKARVGEPCVRPQTGDPVGWTHAARHDEAKVLGFVKGRTWHRVERERRKRARGC